MIDLRAIRLYSDVININDSLKCKFDFIRNRCIVSLIFVNECNSLAIKCINSNARVFQTNDVVENDELFAFSIIYILERCSNRRARSQALKCQSSIFSSIYSIISKCICGLNLVANNIVRTKFIESYQYYQKIRVILLRCLFFFLRAISDNIFSMLTVCAFRISCNRDTCRRTCRFRESSFNDKECMRFVSCSFVKKFIFKIILLKFSWLAKDFVNCKISRSRT